LSFRAKSIKTRIETDWIELTVAVQKSFRAKSIKTRIETGSGHQ